jgi:carbamoyl-phosphate synthase large subunit
MKVAITGLNNIDSPGPGVPVIRGIRDSGKFDGEIIGLIYDALEPGAYMPQVADRSYIIPYPSAGVNSFYERLSQIHSIENLDVIIPTLDAELFAFSKLAPSLEKLGIKTFLPTKEQLILRGKDKLLDFCKKNNINAPFNIVATSVNDLYKLPPTLQYPLVIKGIFYDAYVAHNFQEATSYFSKIAAKWGLPVIVQEFLQGEEYNVVALGDGSGTTIGAVASKKTYITEKGKGWAGVSIYDETLLSISKKIVEILNWRGGAEFEFVKRSDSGEFYLLEINPRFPAWVYLAVGAGQNLPYAALQLARGEKVEPFENYEVGKIFIRYSWDLIVDMKKFEEISVKGVIKND